jgi:hypothetical protein
MNAFGKCCVSELSRKTSDLPCAGITLFRFYGYVLSLRTGLNVGKHPGNLIGQQA